jgi:hypothetical protein
MCSFRCVNPQTDSNTGVHFWSTHRIKTTEIVVTSISSFDHKPISYLETTSSENYENHLQFLFSTSEVSILYKENDKILKSDSVSLLSPDFTVLPSQLPIFLNERFNRVGDTMELYLISPLDLSLIPSLATFESANDIFSKYKIESGVIERWYKIDKDGNPLEIVQNSDGITFRLTSEVNIGSLTPLEEDPTIIAKSPDINIGSREALLSVTYQLNLPHSAYDELIPLLDNLKIIKNIAIKNRNKITIIRNKFVHLPKTSKNRYLSGNEKIKVGEDWAISTSLSITNGMTETTEKVRAIMEYLSNKSSEINLKNMEKAFNNFLTLTRSIGIPSRFSAGFRYQNGNFDFSPFCEFYHDNRWIYCNPTMGIIDDSPLYVSLKDFENFSLLMRFCEKLNNDEIEIDIIDYSLNMEKLIYRDKKFKISIPYSKNFKVKKNEVQKTSTIIFTPNSGENISISFTIVDISGSTKIDHRQFCKNYYMELNKNFGKFGTIDFQKNIIPQYESYCFIYNHDKIIHSDIIIFKSKLLLEISIHGTAKTLEKYSEDIKNRFLRFKLK